MTRRSRLICFAILLTCPVLVLTKDPDYTIMDLPTLPSFSVGPPSAINERGQIVGTLGFVQTHAVMWDDGSVIDLETSSAPHFSAAGGINNRGQVTGSQFTGLTPTNGVIWEKGTVTDLGDFFPGDINDRGQIVSAIGSNAAVWQNGTAVELGVLPGDATSHASAINNRGQIVGISFTAGFSSSRAFIWEKGNISELPGLIGQNTDAFDINERGQAVGSSGLLPVMWDNGTLVRLDTLPPLTNGRAFGINDSGDIVGSLGSPTSSSHVAVLWRNGKPMPLPTLPPGPTTPIVYVATGINNGGTIIGSRTYSGFPFPVVWVRNAR